MRRLIALLFALTLLAVVARPARADTVTVVIYPYTGNSPEAQQAGADVAAVIAAQLKALGGGVNVILAEADVAPTAYRSNALKQNADYYLMGQVAKAPLGSNFLILEQVAKASSGLSLWNHNLTIHTVADASSEGAVLHTLFAQQATSTTPSTTYTGPSPTPSPVAITAAPRNLSAPRANPPPSNPAPSNPQLAQLQAAAAAPATPRPKDAVAYAVVTFGGRDQASALQFVTRAVAESFQKAGSTAGTVALPPGADGSKPLATAGSALCTSTGAATIVAGSIATVRYVESFTESAPSTVDLALQTYDCAQHAISSKAFTAKHQSAVWTDAVRDAANDAVGQYLNSLKQGMGT